MKIPVDIMGILNITPDSFSDGGQYVNHDVAFQYALNMVYAGATIIDIGGESTRPGAERISIAEQKKRVIPVITRLKDKLLSEITISIDTTRSEVATAAIDAGARIINDVSAGRDDPEIFALTAQRRVKIILMHMQGTPKTMQNNPYYQDVVTEIRDFLVSRAELAQDMGVPKNDIIIDPGIGFGKTKEHNLKLLSALNEFVKTGYPVLLGTSRKRFMGTVCSETKPEKLVGATAASTVIGVQAGVHYFRVHDVLENRQAAELAYAIKTTNH